ncbi:hypothetical protein PACILC2_41400 [Paenibacillus cisolokensis]|uniref:Sugar ABC transporter permease n=1 Tax=Paenibacillus cisolokensis TaxID=1658519 RepID=A0ABQ4NBH2_9BACL|nr:hypothetical protein [Paenibacillus cisolokensis]GIQ65572.1 hypothetical protein PACILC2_41400 [Paenibacillus cisolokensis]
MHTLKGTKISIFLGMLPSLLIYIGIAIVPVFMSLYYSFFNWDGLTDKIYIGFDNFTHILSDDIFWLGVKTI